MQTQIQAKQQARVLRVQEPAAIKFLTNIDEIPLLKPFMSQERPLASVAQELNMDLSVLTRKVKRLVGLGLLEVTRTEARAGRSVRHYRSTADEFFIPENAKAIEWMSSQTEASFNRRLDRSLLKVWMTRLDHAGSDWGLKIVHRGESMLIVPVLNQNQNWDSTTITMPTLYQAQGLRLSEQDAAWFCEQVEALTGELLRRQRPNYNRYVLRLALVPEALD
jgi:predicted transcriptional regulator